MKVILFANTDWYLYNFRLPLARALQERGDDVLLLSPPGRYGPLLQAQGLRWLAISMERKGINPFIEAANIFQLWKIFRREKPDLLHNFTIKPMLYGSFAARIARVKRIINAVTGLGFAFSDGQWLLRTIVTGFYRISLIGTKVIFQNPDDRDNFLENGLVSTNQVYLIPGSGVDVDVFRPSPEPAGEVMVMLAGRLLRSKGVPEFVAVARQLRNEGIRARFVIVGEPYPDNPDTIRPEELANWQKEGIVETWGWRDDMAQVIKQSSIICLPSTYREGLPRLLLEAGACGRPVVATDIPGSRLVVRNGENGQMIPPGDVVALANALKTLIQDPALRKKMGLRGREIVEQEFSVKSVVARTLDVYNQS